MHKYYCPQRILTTVHLLLSWDGSTSHRTSTSGSFATDCHRITIVPLIHYNKLRIF